MRQNYLIMGCARSGLATAKFLANKGEQVILTDSKEESKIIESFPQVLELQKNSNIKLIFGQQPDLKVLDEVKEIIMSPGVPLNLPILGKAREKKISIISEIELAYRYSKAPIIAITGTNGKTTTTTLVGEIFKNSGRKTFVVGNIGDPIINYIEEISIKRGIKSINIPTTLLGAVDAAVGGKTGINFNGLKNEIGAFAPAETVLIDSEFFKTLDHPNFLSGYAEMIKHGLISNEQVWLNLLSFDTHQINYDILKELVVESVAVKEKIVEQDPFEKNIRKALNLGHTIGHAFESLSYSINKPVQHGYAVAWGTICELYLSYKKCGFPKDKLWQTLVFIRENYGLFPFSCDDYETLYELMKHDKKNESAERINFTLLEGIGKLALNQTATKDEIFESIDFLRESLGE